MHNKTLFKTYNYLSHIFQLLLQYLALFLVTFSNKNIFKTVSSTFHIKNHTQNHDMTTY